MVYVKKRGGREEVFLADKIMVSAVKSGAPPDDARQIAREIECVAGWGLMTREIRVEVLRRLRARNPELEYNWMIYERNVKKRN